VSANPAADALLPATIGPYKVLWELGRGGMGVVYRARRGDGAEVAIKMPSKAMSDLFGSVRREIHALSRLRHPGVVRIIEEGVDNGVPWYAMELLEGRPLDELLNLGDLDWVSNATMVVPSFQPRAAAPSVDAATPAFERPEVRADLPRALTLMYRLARVLAYIHAHGIVHRDLKPQNIVVRGGDRPVLVDFGLMGQFRAQSGREVLEVGGLMMGTAIYAAPEQAAGELVDARTDLYSFGTMLYEIVTGIPPFQARNVRDLLMMHLQKAPPAPSALVRGVPPVLEKLILNLLEKRRADRLGYADDVSEALVEAGAEADDDFKAETAAYLYRPEIIGRKDTIESLRKSLTAVVDNTGSFVMLGGVSGIGKTSVAATFGREATIRRCLVITAECDPVGGQPLHPLRPLLREIADFCRGRSEIMERVLGPRLSVLREHESSLAALAGDSPRLPPEVASRRLFTDLAETLAAFARERPLVLIVDDLQWADEITLRFLSSLGRDYFAELPLVILGTYRADEAGPDLRALLTRDHLIKILLNRLDDANVADIVRSMLAAPDAPMSFLEFLAAQTEGNPFFVAEYLRTALAEQWLFREKGRWHVAVGDETYASLALPGSVRELVSRRLERLSPLAQRIAETAAVLGRELPEAQLMAVCGESDTGALEGIAELIAQHVFEPTDSANADAVRFAHDKLREAAYARLSEERRRLLHARAAEVIEAGCTTDDELRRHAAALARHFDLGGLPATAIAYYAQAAEAAVGSGACREAVDLMNRALKLDEANASNASTEAKQRGYLHARWHRVLTFAHFGLGDLATSAEEARKSLGEAGVHLPRTSGGWRIRLGTEAARQATHFFMPRGAARADDAKRPLLREITMASQKLSEGRYYTAEQTVMLASGLLAVNAAKRLDDVPGLIHAYANFGAVTSAVGFFRLSRHYYDAARRLALATNDLNGLGHIGYTSAALYITACDWKSCALYLDDAVAAAKKVGDDQVIEMNETAIGLYQFYTGALEQAAETFASVRDRAHKRFNHQHEAWGHSFRAGTLLLMGRLDEALASADAALKLLAGLPETVRLGSQAQCCHALLHQGNRDAALEAADVTADMVSRIVTIIWERYRALSVPAEVYLEHWTPARGRVVRALLKRLHGVSRRMPLALPVTLRLSGVLECLEGNSRRGEKLLRKSIAAAARLQLPIEEGIGEYELARRSNLSIDDLNAHRERARVIFTAAGCELYLRKISDEGA
jgi:serine/threonine protein kinase/tetratricopeptide (TPR) repeat protein